MERGAKRRVVRGSVGVKNSPCMSPFKMRLLLNRYSCNHFRDSLRSSPLTLLRPVHELAGFINSMLFPTLTMFDIISIAQMRSAEAATSSGMKYNWKGKTGGRKKQEREKANIYTCTQSTAVVALLLVIPHSLIVHLSSYLPCIRSHKVFPKRGRKNKMHTVR